MFTKAAPIVIAVLGTILPLELSSMAHTLTQPKQSTSLNFSSTSGYFNPPRHHLTSPELVNSRQKLASHLTDLSWGEKMGPGGHAGLQLTATKTSHPAHWTNQNLLRVFCPVHPHHHSVNMQTQS